MSVPRPTVRRVPVAPGEHVVVETMPGGAPGYVFLHGLGSVRRGIKSDLLFEHAARQGRAAMRYDARGHGESSGQLGVTTVSELVTDAMQLVDAFGPAILVGSSLGGLTAAFVAAAHASVRGLVLLAPAFGFLPRLRQRLEPSGNRVRTRSGLDFVVAQRVLDDAGELDEPSLSDRIRVPTLVVHGDADDVVPPALSERFVAALAAERKDLWIVPGGSHRLHESFAGVLQRMDAVFGPA